MVNLADYPTVRWAREIPEHPALIAGLSVMSYSDFEERIKATAYQLMLRGVGPRDRIILCAANSTQWIITAHAVARLAAVLIPVSTRIIAADAIAFLERYKPVLVLTDSEVGTLWPDSTLLADVDVPGSDFNGSEIRWESDSDALHSIVSTSGSGGEPKGVCLTLRNHLANALGSALNLGVHADDRWLLNLPLYHIGGMAVMFRAAMYGTTVVVHDRFDAESTWRAIDENRVTQMSLVATTLRRLLDARPTRKCPNHLRSVLVGGGPVPESLIDEARGEGFPVLPTYGMTETSSQFATLSPADSHSKRHTAGRPLAFGEIMICDERDAVTPEGVEGRIYVRGPMVGMGYWNPNGTVEPLLRTDGWFPTTDIGSVDAQGYLTVHGRLDNVIISGGEKIHAEELENALAHIDGVAHAVVVGADDAEWGQRPMAYVELRPGNSLSESAIMTLLGDRVARHKLPIRIEFLPGMPLLPSGKPDRRAVQSRLAASSTSH
jgi:O-succinylbenzoic acid--CoA ligase